MKVSKQSLTAAPVPADLLSFLQVSFQSGLSVSIYVSIGKRRCGRRVSVLRIRVSTRRVKASMLVNGQEENVVKVKPVGAGLVGACDKWCHRLKESWLE